MKVIMLLAMLTPGLASAAVTLKNSGGELTFLAVGKPSMLKIKGRAENPEAHFTVDGASLSGTAEVEMEKFGSGIALRDRHMKERYLETARFPKSKLTVKNLNVGINFADTLSVPSQNFEGLLSFHGQEHAVKGSFAGSNGALTASFTLSLKEFGVEIPSYLGVTVAENVDVEVSLSLVKE
ncbi:MAG: YceI family protein [Proteobacteria bacterium]|nr:MAG: YceI family protein [Pseudomonadota bacterium]